jgi:hypothetical protein
MFFAIVVTSLSLSIDIILQKRRFVKGFSQICAKNFYERGRKEGR